MTNPAMEHRRDTRLDSSEMHLAQLHFENRDMEAEWIAESICTLVPPNAHPAVGALHDDRDGAGASPFRI